MDLENQSPKNQPKFFSLRTFWLIVAFFTAAVGAASFLDTPLFAKLRTFLLSKLLEWVDGWANLVFGCLAVTVAMGYGAFLLFLYSWKYGKPKEKLNKVVRVILDVLVLSACVILSVSMENSAGFFALLCLCFHLIPLLELSRSAEDYGVLDASLAVLIEVFVKVSKEVGLAKWVVAIIVTLLLGLKNMIYHTKKNAQESHFKIKEGSRAFWLSLVILSWIGSVLFFKYSSLHEKLAKRVHDLDIPFWHVVYDIIIEVVAILVAVIVTYFSAGETDLRWQMGAKWRFCVDWLLLLICFCLGHLIDDEMGLGALLCITFATIPLAQLIQPAADYGVLDALMALSMLVTVELSKYPSLSPWIVLVLCSMLIVLKYIFLPSEPSAPNTPEA